MTNAYRVTNPSRNPAQKVNGMVLRRILNEFLNPILKELNLERVLGNNILPAKIKPAEASMTIANISILP